VPTLIQRIYSDGGFLANALKKDDTGWSMEILHSFMEFAVQQNNRIPFISLKEMISMFQKMEKSEIPLFLEKRIGNSSGVQLLTAHGSKGLEFEHVYILRGNDTVWEKDEGMKLPYNIRQLILGNNRIIESESSVSDSFEERRRLFYVAMTRAKKQLTISYCKYKIASKVSDSLASTFVLDIAKENQLSKEPLQIPIEKLREIISRAVLPVVLMGGSEDQSIGEQLAVEFPEVLQTCGHLRLMQSASLISKAEWVVTGDTGLMHMASAFNKKIVSIWGNTIPEFGMGPYLPNAANQIRQIDHLPCRPCSKLGHSSCPAGHFRCMQDQDFQFISELSS
jgi:hypothetical protein